MLAASLLCPCNSYGAKHRRGTNGSRDVPSPIQSKLLIVLRQGLFVPACFYPTARNLPIIQVELSLYSILNQVGEPACLLGNKEAYGPHTG